MASLKSTEVRGEPDPRIAFHLQLLGYMKYSKGKSDPDWYETRVGVEIFNTRVDRPDPHICKSDIESLVRWLRELVEARDPVRPFFTVEPMFRVTAEPIAGPTFLVRVLVQAWRTVPMFFSEEEGLAVLLPVSAESLIDFSKQLEEEMATIARSEGQRRKILGG